MVSKISFEIRFLFELSNINVTDMAAKQSLTIVMDCESQLKVVLQRVKTHCRRL